MQENKSYEYAVIRLVPRIEREEFINIGVLLYAPAQNFLDVKFHLYEKRIASLCADIDAGEIQKYLDSIALVCKGGKEAGQMGHLPTAQRFRWLSATRSTIIQLSKVHTGISDNPPEKLNRLYEQLVL